MRKVLSIVVLMVCFGSCCTKKHCEGNLIVIAIDKFELKRDSYIIYTKFQKNTNFNQQVESDTILSMNLYNNYLDSILQIALPFPMAPDFDYSISVFPDDKQFYFNEFKVKIERCNTCFPFGTDDYDNIVGCHENNRYHEVNNVGLIVKM